MRFVHGRSSTRPLALLASIALVAATRLAAPALAIVQPAPSGGASVELAGGSTVRIADAVRAQALEAAPEWQTFLARNGEWRPLMWNGLTGSPHRAIGPGIILPGFAGEPGSVDRVVRDFVASNPEIFGAATLRTLAAFRAGALWHVRYRQTIDGLDVLDSDWEFRLSADGRLIAFGADVQRGEVPAFTPIPVMAARAIASAGIEYEPDAGRIEGGSLSLLPVVEAGGLALRPVYEFDVSTLQPARWRTRVDAASGAVLERENLLRPEVQGETRGAIHPRLPTDALVSRAFPHLNVDVDGTVIPSDVDGRYTAPAAGDVTVTAAISGRFCTILRVGGNASFTQPVRAPANVDVDWTDVNSTDSERDAYYHVNVAHDHVKALDPGLHTLDYAMPVRVNINASCNAFWSGSGLLLFRAGGACPSTATMPDIIYHEYGHGVNDRQYAQAGIATGMRNAALHEGLADAFAAFIQDDPKVGKGLFGPGSYVRDLVNQARWPQNQSDDSHLTGLIVAGALWDLRGAIGLAATERLMHFARYGVPDDVNAGVAMAEFFVEMVLADDDDGNPTNGTPHFGTIASIFNQRGIGTRLFLEITHTPLVDRVAGPTQDVIATVRRLAPILTLDLSRLAVVYSVNRGPDQVAPLVPDGTPDRYRAVLDAPAPATVSYYVTASDAFGETVTSPGTAPDKRHTFVVGPQTNLIFQTMEEDNGWIPRALTDNAIFGRWVRAVPTGTFVGRVPVQPGEDHSPAGVACWVTGNSPGGFPVDHGDVDFGRTTLRTPVFDATEGGLSEPTLEYYRWYSNDAGPNPGTDIWRVDVSNDGGVTWVPVESTRASDNTWRRVAFRIGDIIAPTDQMQLRFIASDDNPQSLVEAAVDDFRLFGFHIPPTTHVESPNGGEVLTVGMLAHLAWQAEDDVAVTGVDLLLSRHGPAGPFEPIAANLPPTGGFDWRVTGPASAAAVLKVVARDRGGNTGEDTSDATFGINSTPDCGDARALIAEVWPPNHELVPIAITGVIDPDGDPLTVTVTGVTSDEPVEGGGAGHTCPDAMLQDGVATVRLERAATGNGRVYAVRFTATDGRGGACDGAVRVCVPHDRNDGVACVDDGQTVNALGPCERPLAREALPAAAFDVSPGDGVIDIRYALPADADVWLSVYDVTGRRVAVVERGRRSAGDHAIRWRDSALGSGIYFYRLEAGDVRFTRSVLHLR